MECIVELKEEIRKNNAVLLLVSNLEAEFIKKNEALNILDFLGEQKGLSFLVQSLASNITAAKKQVKEYFLPLLEESNFIKRNKVDHYID